MIHKETTKFITMIEKGLYKYVIRDSGEIVYIGKSDWSIKRRLQDHNSCLGIDAKFKDYIEKCDIFVTEINNPIETEILEKALIDKYKPVLNETYNYPEISKYFSIIEPTWTKIPIKFKIGTIKKQSNEKDLRKDIKLFYGKFHFNYYNPKIPNDISGYITVSNLIYDNDIGAYEIFASDESAIKFLKDITRECYKRGRSNYNYTLFGSDILKNGIPTTLLNVNENHEHIRYLNLKIEGFHIIPLVNDIKGEGREFQEKIFVFNFMAIDLLRQGFKVE